MKIYDGPGMIADKADARSSRAHRRRPTLSFRLSAPGRSARLVPQDHAHLPAAAQVHARSGAQAQDAPPCRRPPSCRKSTTSCGLTATRSIAPCSRPCSTPGRPRRQDAGGRGPARHRSPTTAARRRQPRSAARSPRAAAGRGGRRAAAQRRPAWRSPSSRCSHRPGAGDAQLHRRRRQPEGGLHGRPRSSMVLTARAFVDQGKLDEARRELERPPHRSSIWKMSRATIGLADKLAGPARRRPPLRRQAPARTTPP